MKNRIENIKNKINRLKELSEDLNLFASNKHQFKLNNIKSETQLKEFETENSILLPNEYREFIKTIGNGGLGPNYGLETIENGKYRNLDIPTTESLPI